MDTPLLGPSLDVNTKVAGLSKAVIIQVPRADVSVSAFSQNQCTMRDVCTYMCMPIDIDVLLGGVYKMVCDRVHDHSTSMVAH